jgi:hypothetical protein
MPHVAMSATTVAAVCAESTRSPAGVIPPAASTHANRAASPTLDSSEHKAK